MMGPPPKDRSLFGNFVDALAAAFSRLARWLVGPEQIPHLHARSKAQRKDKRSGRFNSRRDRRKNIVATIDRWRDAESHASLPSAAKPALPYCRVQGVLSKGERAFWVPLFQAVKGKYRIFCKVRLSDVICCPSEHPEEPRWFRKIGRYHVDFVVCEPDSTYPLLVIELDDRSHRGSDRNRKLDEWKDEVLRAARLPVYRVPARKAYDVLELAQTIDRMIGEAEG